MENRRIDNRSLVTGNDNNIRKVIEYIDKGAKKEELVNLFRVGGYIEQIVRSDSDTKPHQLRRFYDYLVAVTNREQAASVSSVPQNGIRLQLLRMVPIADYSSKRRLLGRVYREFITKSAETVAKKEDSEFSEALERFRGAYEALVAFYAEGGK